MPIDPSIPLGARAPQLPSMAEMTGGAYQLRAMRDAERQRIQAQEENEAVKQAIAASGGNLEAALPAITKVSPMTGLAIGEKVASARKARTEALEADQKLVNARLAHDLQLADVVGRAFVGVRDDSQEDWDAALAQLQANGLDNPRIPRRVNNAYRDRLVAEAMDVKTQLDERRKSAEEAAKKPKLVAEWLGTVGQVLGGVTDQESLDGARMLLKEEGAPDTILSQIPEKYSADAVEAASRLGLTAEQRDRAVREGRGSDYAQALRREEKRIGKPVDDWTREEEFAFRRQWEALNDRAPQAANRLDPDDIAAVGDAIISGQQPPTLQGLYGQGARVRAYLAKQGFNLANAEQDWRATSRYMQSLNGTQQLRMRQAVSNAYHSLDTIEAAAKAWEGGNFQDLNKARLALAKRGNIGGSVKASIPMLNKATGKIEMRTKTWTAAEIAQVLEAQIADVTSELANVYMGGNSPTDHALTLAGENLSADWDKQRLLTLIDQSRTNLKIRENSMNVGPAGASGAYMPTGSPAPGSEVGAAAIEEVKPAQVPQSMVDHMKDKPVGSRSRLNGVVYIKTRTGVVPE